MVNSLFVPNMKFVVFRDQTYGMHLKQINGFDNNFIENIAFVNCNIGFYQQPLVPYVDLIHRVMLTKLCFIKVSLSIAIRHFQ
jgi:hypothetical protein